MADTRQAAGGGHAASDGPVRGTVHATEAVVRDTEHHPGRNARIGVREVGRDVEEHPKAVAGGAATGAAGGAVFGGPPGAVIGGIAGAIRGLLAADAIAVIRTRLSRTGRH